MITPRQLFLRRLFSEWKFQYSVWKTVINWQVVLYVIVPDAAICIYNYALLWVKPPGWFNTLPIRTFLPFVALFACAGTIRIFLEAGDQLFLWQRKNWIKQIERFSLAYAAVNDLFATVLVFILLSPILVIAYKMSAERIAILITFTFLIKMNSGLVKQLISIRLDGWSRTALLMALFVSIQTIFLEGADILLSNHLACILSVTFLSITLFLLMRGRLHRQGTFFADIERESGERLRYASFLLKISGLDLRKPNTRRKRAVLFTNSAFLFRQRNAVNILAETCIKLFWRNGRNLSWYVVLVALCGAILWSTKFLDGLFLWPFLAALIALWVKFFWNEVMASDFMMMFRWKTQARDQAARKSVFLLMLPGFLLVSFAFGYHSFTWLSALVALPVGCAISYFVAGIVCSSNINRLRPRP
jgi:ABC-2 type transport system permease protein